MLRPFFSFNRIWRLANQMTREIEHEMNRNLYRLQTMDYFPPRIDENTYYKKTIMTDNNGHVKVKTITKEPGREFEIHEEEYHRGKDKQAIETQEKKNQQTITDNPSGKEEAETKKSQQKIDNNQNSNLDNIKDKINKSKSQDNENKMNQEGSRSINAN